MAHTYADAGVDIDASNRATAALVAQLRGPAREGDGAPITLENGFAGLVQLGDGALAICTDGVGTKLLLARELGGLDTVGIDCVAMNVNDLICVGAEPLSFVDYVALEEPDAELMAQLGAGLAEGCRQANCTLSGGETAVVPELVHGFDLAGTAVGWVARGDIIDGSRVGDGDALIGLASSGPHSNGYSLIRKLLADSGKSAKSSWHGNTLGQELLSPTRIYVRAILKLLDTCPVHGIAHITGGGLPDNLERILPPSIDVHVEPTAWQRPVIFDWLQDQGRIETGEMYRTFNCGIGMAVIIPEHCVDEAVALLMGEGETASVIGEVVKGGGQVHIPS